MTFTQQSLIEAALAALPREFSSDLDAREWLRVQAVAIGASYDQVTEYVSRLRTRAATGPWLDLLASERGTSRRNSETDDVLGARLRTPSDALTPFALVGNNGLLINYTTGLDAVTYSLLWLSDAGYEMVNQVGLPDVDTSSYVYLYWNESPTRGDGEYVVFRSVNGVNEGIVTLSPDAGHYIDEWDPADGTAYPIDIAEARQEGIATIIMRAANQPIPHNYPAIVELKHDQAFCKQGSTPMAFCDRGFRAGKPGPSIIVILPYGTANDADAAIVGADSGTASSVESAVKQFKAGGVAVQVESRTSP